MGIENTRPAAIDAGQSLGAVRMGNPPAKYTVGLHQVICENIKKGNRPVTAAQMAGIPSHTFYRWMTLGKQGDPHLYQFAEDVEQSIAIFEGSLVETVIDASKDDAKHAEFMLERRFAEAYAKDVDAKVNAIISNFMAALKAQLSEGEYYKILAISSGYSGVEANRLTEGSNVESEPEESPESA